LLAIAASFQKLAADAAANSNVAAAEETGQRVIARRGPKTLPQ
jgi:hypothetical protein